MLVLFLRPSFFFTPRVNFRLLARRVNPQLNPMSSGGRSAEQQAVAEHNLEGQHLLGQREALLQELRDKSGKDIKWPHPCVHQFVNPSTPVMDENLAPNAQLSMLEQSPRPCRREQHQPVVNAKDDEGKLALSEEQVASMQRKLDDSLQRNLGANEIAKQLRTELAESEAAVEVQRSRALASEEQVASLQGELDDSLQLLAEAHHSRCGLLKSMQAALVVTSEQLARAKTNEQATRAHLLRVYMLFAAFVFATLLYNLFMTWSVLDGKADLLALKADFVSYYENCKDIAAKEMAPVYQNCQDVAATCESVKTDIVSYFSAQVAFAAWLHGLGLGLD